VLGSHAGRRYGYLAGLDHERLADLNTALAADDMDAIWCIRGGYGVTRILGGVDFTALARRPKPVIGFSDITALLNALTRVTGVVTFHGPTARHPLTAFGRRHFERVLSSPAAPGRLERLVAPAGVLVPAAPRIVTIVPGRAEGILIGGNLTLLQCLIGTPWQPALAGALLFLEDVGEDLYRVDRALDVRRRAGLRRGARQLLRASPSADRVRLPDRTRGRSMDPPDRRSRSARCRRRRAGAAGLGGGVIIATSRTS
jgi:muramoyltetrapeptide carboxypeptidase